jgi:hypothetical protein
MTVEEADRIDSLGRNRMTGSPALMISDHLPWDEYGEHFELIEKKLGAYLGFVRSGQIWEHIRGERQGQVTIELIYKYPPTPLAERFLSAARDQLLKDDDVVFTYRALREKADG